MIKINVKKILAIKANNTDRTIFYFREYQKEPNPSKQLRLLKKIQILQGRK